MERDRLAGLRNGPSAVGYRSADYVPVSDVGYHEDTAYGYGGYGYLPAEEDDAKLDTRISLSAPGESMYELSSIRGEHPQSFWDEVTEVQNALSAMNNAITRLRDAQDASLANSDDASQRVAQADVDAASSDARSLSNATKNKIQVLATRANRLPPGREHQTQDSQIAALRRKFKMHVQRYTELESAYHKKIRARAERQLRVIRPEASADEVEAALDEGGAGAFTQALMSRNRQGEAENALSMVQDRHAEIRKIEQTVAELAQLFNDVDILLSEQDEQVDVVASNAEETSRYMNTGQQSTSQAVEKARKARKKKIYCIWIIVVVVIIVVVLIVAAICGTGACASHNN